jgi:hypothetical protein
MNHNQTGLPATAADDSKPTPQAEAGERLWCIHIEGPGDYIAAGSREDAEREASAINAYLASSQNTRRVAGVRAVAIEWPFTPASHARSLEVDWDDLEHMPHRRRAGVGPL